MTTSHHDLPSHHGPDGTFHNPWRQHRPSVRDLFRLGQRMRQAIETLRPGQLPAVTPNPAQPRARGDQMSITWIGHSTNLVQLGGQNILTDPIWSDRASPLRFVGPRRFMPPGIAIEDLPPIDMVLPSHDHYDHADVRSIRRIRERFPDAIWRVPIGLEGLLKGLRVPTVESFDWWDARNANGLTVTSVPSQHFSGRGFRRNRSLWCGWVVTTGERSVYFVGDTGWFPEFPEIARRCAPFDAILMPIGAYDPRWFMAPVHVNPEEAVRAYVALAEDRRADRACYLVANHWGTFRLTPEPLEEPPRRLRRAWMDHGLPIERLWILAHGETRWLAT